MTRLVIRYNNIQPINFPDHFDGNDIFYKTTDMGYDSSNAYVRNKENTAWIAIDAYDGRVIGLVDKI